MEYMEVPKGLIRKCLIISTHQVKSELEKAKDPDILPMSDNSYFYQGSPWLNIDVWMTCCGGLDVKVRDSGFYVLSYRSYESFDEPDEEVEVYKPSYWERVIEDLYQGLKEKGLDYVKYYP